MSQLEGIDISHYQTGLSIAKAKPAFAIMKATEGTTYVDPTCDGFVSQCKNAGVLYGVYHFAHSGSDAEADWFVKNTKGYHGKGVLVLDWEADAVGKGVSAAKNFLDRVYDKTGVRPLIYMSQSVTQSYDWSSVAKNYGLWVARYGTDSYGDTGAWGSPAMWQYTSSGSVSGYSGAVDKNHFYGDKNAWAAFASGGEAQVSTRSRSEAVDWAQAKVGTTGYGGMCLQFTREAYNIASKYESARDAWNGAKHKHSTSSTSGMPTGVPIFFDSSSSEYGHVAVYVGGGKMVTTHESTNKIGQDSVSTWVNDYGYHILGWSEDLNGVMIPDDSGNHTDGSDDKPIGVPKVDADGVWGSGTTTQRQTILTNMGLYSGSIDGVVSNQNPYWKSKNPGLTSGWDWDSSYKGKGGSKTIKADQQRLAKIKGKDGKPLYGGSIDGLAGEDYFRALQKEQQTTVDGVVSHPSKMVKAMQADGNKGKIS
jgi:lysozyme